jgi:hypothetical protein
VTAQWPAARYNLSMYGPNGFVRSFVGESATAALSSALSYDADGDVVVVTAAVDASVGDGKCLLELRDNAYGAGTWQLTAVPGQPAAFQRVPVGSSGSWYDLTLQLVPSDACPVNGTFERRFMGHMETGRITTSDPAMAAGAVDTRVFPAPPHKYRTVEKWTVATRCNSRRARLKDACWSMRDDKAMLSRMEDRDEL